MTPLCQEAVGTGGCDDILCQDTDMVRRHCGVENTGRRARGGRGDALVSQVTGRASGLNLVTVSVGVVPVHP